MSGVCCASCVDVKEDADGEESSDWSAVGSDKGKNEESDALAEPDNAVWQACIFKV